MPSITKYRLHISYFKYKIQFSYLCHRAWALYQMVKNKQTVDEVEAMRDSLVHEGWMVRDDLPKGWRVRQGKKNKLDFMTPSGKWFPSLGNARAHVEKFGPCDFDFSRLKKNLQKEQSNNKKKGLVVGQKKSQKANVINGGDDIAAGELSTHGSDKLELMESVSGVDNVDHNLVAEEENQEESQKSIDI